MLTTPEYVNCYQHHWGVPPKQSARRRALGGAALFLKHMRGIDTVAKAATFADVSRPTMSAAVIVLKSGDTGLIQRVLDGRVPLHLAAEWMRKRVKLIEAFMGASDADRIAFGQAVGPGELFDHVVIPAL